MSRNLLDTIYDGYLNLSKKGKVFEVPIHHINDDGEEEFLKTVQVWAKDETQAEMRALSLAIRQDRERQQSMHDKSLGLVMPKEYYQPKGFWRKLTSPFAVWRDPVYKKGASSVVGTAGYKVSSMTRSAISHMLKTVRANNNDGAMDKASLEKALKVIIISIFLWVGLSILGLIFFIIGLDQNIANKFYLKWLNPFLVAGVVCLLLGGLATFRSIRDYKWTIRVLDKYDDPTINIKVVEDE